MHSLFSFSFFRSLALTKAPKSSYRILWKLCAIESFPFDSRASAWQIFPFAFKFAACIQIICPFEMLANAHKWRVDEYCIVERLECFCAFVLDNGMAHSKQDFESVSTICSSYLRFSVPWQIVRCYLKTKKVPCEHSLALVFFYFLDQFFFFFWFFSISTVCRSMWVHFPDDIIIVKPYSFAFILIRCVF